MRWVKRNRYLSNVILFRFWKIEIREKSNSMKRIECTSCSFVALLYDNQFYSTSIIWGTKFNHSNRVFLPIIFNWIVIDYIILSFKVNNEPTRMKYITIKRIVKSHNGWIDVRETKFDRIFITLYNDIKRIISLLFYKLPDEIIILGTL